jgi:hypothetical protein
MSEVEIGAWEWLAKVNEKLTFLRLKVLDHKEIADSDYELLRIFFKIWSTGEYPLYVTRMEGVAEKTCQNTLFNTVTTDNTSITTDGTTIAYSLSESKTEENE